MVTPVRKPKFDVEQGIIPRPEKIEFYLRCGNERLRYWVNERPTFYIDQGERGDDSEWEEYSDLSGPTVRVTSVRQHRGDKTPKIELVHNLDVGKRGQHASVVEPAVTVVRNNLPTEVVLSTDLGLVEWKEYFVMNKLHPCQGGITSWSEVVRKRRPAKDYVLSKRVLPAGEKPLSETIKLMDLPEEIFRHILVHLNAFDLQKLGRLDRNVERKFYNAMVDNDDEKLRFWEETLLKGMHRGLMLKVLCSYYSVVNFNTRVNSPEHMVDFALSKGIEDIGRAVLNYWDIIENADLVLDDMTTYEIATKESLRAEKYGCVKLVDVARITGTAGCFLYNYWFPIEHSREKDDEQPLGFVSIVDAIFCSKGIVPMYRWISLCQDDCRFVTVMYIPFVSDPTCSKFSLDRLPKQTIRVLVSVCKKCYHFQTIEAGEGKYLAIPCSSSAYDCMNPLIAVHKNFIGGWENPHSFRVHQVWAESKAPGVIVIRTFVIQNVYFNNPREHWERIANYREYYIPKLVKVKHNWDDLTPERQSALRKFYTKEYVEEHFELHLISSTFGVEILGPSSPYYMTKHFSGSLRPLHMILRQFPEYYIENASAFRDKVSVVEGGTSDFGMNVFWSKEGLAVSWDEHGALKWLFQDWESILKSVKEPLHMKNRNIRHVEICWFDGIAIAVNDSIIILKVIFQSGGTYRKLLKRMFRTIKSEPKLIVYPVRVINLNLDHMVIHNFSCDFAAGIPYVLVELRDTDSTGALDYYLKRFSFGFGPGEGFPQKMEFKRNEEWKEHPAESNEELPSTSRNVGALARNPDLFEMATYEEAIDQRIHMRNSSEQSSRL